MNSKIVILAVLSFPAVAFGQTQQEQKCRPVNVATVLEPGEKLVKMGGSYWACKPVVVADVKAVPAKAAEPSTARLPAAWAPATRPAPTPAPSLRAQDSGITNARVIEMTKLGLGDEILIARIKTGSCKFALSDSDLAALKKANVSDKVIAAMLEASVLIKPRITIDGNPLELHTIGQEKLGGRLGHELTFHIKSIKEKAYLQGQHASVFASSKPVIQIELPPNISIDDYILVLMDGKGDRRELEVASSQGIAVGHKSGIRSDRVMKTSYEPMGGRLYMVTVASSLKQGDYIIFIVGSADYEKGIFGRGYDFTVE